jgi:ankyrin repeat protein
VRRTLDELPESLDETYERVLREIKKPNRDHACRLLQCLVVAIRPLRVEELAEVLAVDFDDEEGIPKLKLNWRWEDQEQALLSSCSSLISIVESGRSRVVQFSHFSVKEFLTSSRLGTSSGDTSRYHILLEPAHTILAQACLSVLLRLDDCVEQSDIGDSFPLARYAAEHWVAHAQDEKVSSCLQKAMEYLFDVDKPYFAAWLQLHDIDTDPWLASVSTLYLYPYFTRPESGAAPLYYAALCGFQNLVEHLTVNDPEQVNATGGHYVTPLAAALGKRHFQTAKFLSDNGADPNVKGNYGKTPLLSAAYSGDLEMVQALLKYKADMNARDKGGENALHNASNGSSSSPSLDIGPSSPNVVRLLLKHGADVNARTDEEKGHFTPLHLAAKKGRIEIVHVLLQHGANVGMKDGSGITALHQAARFGWAEVVRILLRHGANVCTKDGDGRTALHQAAQFGSAEVVRVLLQYGAKVGTKDGDGETALYQAAQLGRAEVVRVLLRHGAYVGTKDGKGRTALHQAAQFGWAEVVRVLLQYGANVGTKDGDGRTALHQAAQFGRAEVVRVLLQHGANVGTKDGNGRTALQIASDKEHNGIMKLLSEHRAR